MLECVCVCVCARARARACVYMDVYDEPEGKCLYTETIKLYCMCGGGGGGRGGGGVTLARIFYCFADYFVFWCNISVL